MDDAPEFRPYGLPHLTVILITIVLPFALASLVRRTKSQRIERLIIAALSAVLILNYLAYLIFIRSQGDVDRTPALVRSRIFLGDRRHVASSPHAEPSLWVSRLAIHQLFHLPLWHHCRRGFPHADSPLSSISDVPCARLVVVAVLFRGHAGR